MTKGMGFWEQMAARGDLPGEGIPGQSLVELLGEHRVLIEGHRGVREYCRERIGVKVNFGIICVCGSGLELAHMTAEQLVIRGRIDGITLQRRA